MGRSAGGLLRPWSLDADLLLCVMENRTSSTSRPPSTILARPLPVGGMPARCFSRFHLLFRRAVASWAGQCAHLGKNSRLMLQLTFANPPPLGPCIPERQSQRRTLHPRLNGHQVSMCARPHSKTTLSPCCIANVSGFGSRSNRSGLMLRPSSRCPRFPVTGHASHPCPQQANLILRLLISKGRKCNAMFTLPSAPCAAAILPCSSVSSSKIEHAVTLLTSKSLAGLSST